MSPADRNPDARATSCNRWRSNVECKPLPSLSALEPQVIYVEPEQGTGRLGYSDFDPALMAQPLRWF
jgi:hypothetical protein